MSTSENGSEFLPLGLEIDPAARPLIPQPHGGALAPPFALGVSGNPDGRALEERRLTKALARRLEAKGAERGTQGAEALADWLLDIASDPKAAQRLGAIREAWDRLEGPITQRQEHSIQVDKTVVTHDGPEHAPALPEAESADPSDPDLTDDPA